MKDVMIDIETLGTRSDALILQIGACYFDRETGSIGKTFSVNINPGTANDRFSVDYDTIKWWFGQLQEARDSVMSKPIGIKDAILSLHDFLDSDETNIWSHATFDMPIILHAFEVIGLRFPIHYRRMRDIRTLMDLANHRSEKERDGIHHNALDDCKFQVQYCVEAMQILKHANT